MDEKKPSSKSPEERVEDLLNRREREAAEAAAGQSEVPAAGSESSAAGGESSMAGGEPSAAGGESSVAGASSRDRTPLTEKQRIEARRLRREKRRRGRGKDAARRPAGAGRSAASGRGSSPQAGSTSGLGGGNPLSRGVKATGREIRRAAGFLFAALLAGLDRLGPFFSSAGEAVSSLLAAVARGLSGLTHAFGRALHGLGALLLAAERQFTPRRATYAVAGAGVIVLGVSQFLDFRAIEVGRSGYSAVQEIARAPRVDVQTPMDAHSVLLLLVAALAAGCLAALALTGRRLFGIGLSLAGLATIAVAALVDLPQGLDTEEAAIAFTGVAAVLLTGFWLQVAAGVVLAATGLLLAVTGPGREKSTDASRAPARSRSVRERPA
jgi:hypothetical protein